MVGNVITEHCTRAAHRRDTVQGDDRPPHEDCTIPTTTTMTTCTTGSREIKRAATGSERACLHQAVSRPVLFSAGSSRTVFINSHCKNPSLPLLNTPRPVFNSIRLHIYHMSSFSTLAVLCSSVTFPPPPISSAVHAYRGNRNRDHLTSSNTLESKWKFEDSRRVGIRPPSTYLGIAFNCSD